MLIGTGAYRDRGNVLRERLFSAPTSCTLYQDQSAIMPFLPLTNS